jgi:hypothetical protein
MESEASRLTNTLTPRGAAAVGLVADLQAVEAGAVMYFRLWHDGPSAREIMSSDFVATMGPDIGRRTLASFQAICSLCATHGRRTLVHHHLNCRCVGADEACFANFIGAAAEGAHEDALLIATMLVRADLAPSLTYHAEAFGLALKRMELRAAQAAPDRSHSQVIH